MPPTNPPKFCMARYQRARSRAPPCGSAEGEFQSLMKMVREEHLHHMGGCDVKSKPEFQIAFPYNGNRRSFVFQLDRPDRCIFGQCMHADTVFRCVLWSNCVQFQVVVKLLYIIRGR